MKKLLSLFLALALLFSLGSAVFAADDAGREAADALYALGLFQGTGTDAEGQPVFELDRAPTRYEALVMLVRLLGKEGEARTGSWENAFSDVAEWARPYVGYAYANGLTAGTGETTFSGDRQITASQYLTFVLRALGYDSATDFRWDAAWEFSDEIGLTSEGARFAEAPFLRAHVAAVSFSALRTPLKGDDETLAEKLIAEGVFTQAQYDAALSPAQTPAEDPYDQETVYAKLIAMKEELPEGLRWTNEDEYTLHYEEVWEGVTRQFSFTGMGCVAFAFRVSSAAFGELPLRTLERGDFAYEDLRVGDMPRINGDTHTVIILEIHDDHVVIAEGNFKSSVHWGRTLTRQQLMQADYVWTRYPA